MFGWVASVAGFFVPACVARRWAALRSAVYDRVIAAMTTRWYRTFITACPMGAHVLDVGIGTATPLLNNRDLVLTKGLTFCGVDYEQAYVDAARHNVAAAKMQSSVELVCASIHDFTGGPFDAVYFSGSFMIIPDKVKCLVSCRKMLRCPGQDKVFFTQTLEHRGLVGSLMQWVKPLLKMTLTIDFGTVTYRDEFEQCVKEAGMEIVDFQVMSSNMFRQQVIVTAQ